MKWLSYLQIKRPAVVTGMSARFALGDRVSVRQGSTQEGGSTPYYVRGKSGIVEEVGEASNNPVQLLANPVQLLADRGATTPPRKIYRMRFAAREVWPESPDAPGDTLALRISEDQLEPPATNSP
jgi:hypothetical protein